MTTVLGTTSTTTNTAAAAAAAGLTVTTVLGVFLFLVAGLHDVLMDGVLWLVEAVQDGVHTRKLAHAHTHTRKHTHTQLKLQ